MHHWGGMSWMPECQNKMFTRIFSFKDGIVDFLPGRKMLRWVLFLARWLTSARAYRIGGRKLCPSVCLYVKRYLLLQFCTDYNQTWINMIWAVAAKTLLSQIFHNWRRIEVNCVYISHCKWYRTSAGMPACIPNRRCCAGQCAGQ